MNIYSFTVKDNKGNDVILEKYKGKLVLIVNTATKCGLTPQYTALQELYKEYNDRGFEILDFPCNQFAEQAPGDDDEIEQFCSLNYETSFPRFQKIDVNGENAAPLFVWLKENAPKDISNREAVEFEKRIADYGFERKNPSDILWNFGKFLIGRDGEISARFSPAFSPEKLSAEIEDLL